jgi:hypothetical protein
MILDFGMLQHQETLFIFLNIFFCVTVFVWLLILFFEKRHLFIKPSIQLIAFTNIFYQWPLAIYSSHYGAFLPKPFDISFLIHTYTCMGLLLSTFTLDTSSRSVWLRLMKPSTRTTETRRDIKLLLLFSVMLITLYYLSRVPIAKTGLYAILFAPETATMAREESLKLLDDQLLKYAFAIMKSALIPLLVAICSLCLLENLKQHHVKRAIVNLIIIALLGLIVSLPGDRSSLVYLLIVVAASFFLSNGLRVRPVYVIVFLALALFPSVLLGLLREGNVDIASNLMGYYAEILDRAFVTPFDVCTWYIHYAQTHGTLGIYGVPKISHLFGAPSVDLPNLMALTYGKNPLPTASANAGYLLTYYSYFGMPSLLLSLPGLLLSDVAVIAYLYMDDDLLLPSMSAIALSTLMFILSDYTTVFITHGFAVILIITLLLSKLHHPRFRARQKEREVNHAHSSY